ncbi:hypothetical protein [Serratia phage SMP]|uniref:Transmembrane protein n=1 Tax=Serratia phage SMP TaxID=2982904 RepID=A0A9E8JWN8_9CAUD|nr:hypothetical protein [Serratia phage SMP]
MWGFSRVDDLMVWCFGLCVIVVVASGSLFVCWWLLVKAIQLLEK